MPIATSYSCAKCTLRGSEFVTWGEFNYYLNGEIFQVTRIAGICYNCNSVVPVEVLPVEKEKQRALYNDYSSNYSYSSTVATKIFTALYSRESPARCLECGGHDFEVLHDLNPDNKRLKSGTPIRTGIIHRDCGGRIYADFSGPNYFMGNNLPKRVFNIEGLEIKYQG